MPSLTTSATCQSVLFFLSLLITQVCVALRLHIGNVVNKPPQAIDLRSDTVTSPSVAMRKAMAEAEVGDDVFGEDPTVNMLEKRTAELLNKESCLFFPSGTMANLAATMSWCKERGSEMILGDSSHMYLFEQGGTAQIAGVTPRPVFNLQDGTMKLESIEASIRSDNIHFPRTGLVCLENTHNYCGGRVLAADYTDEVCWMANNRDVPVHLDGARIWNAAASLDAPVSELVHSVDSVSASLCKGLGAPAGSILAGPEDFITSARRARKVLGGGMRQAGILAAAALVGIDDFEAGMLQRDHRKARRMADAINDIPGIDVDAVDTNVVLVHLEYESMTAQNNPSFFSNKLKERGVLLLPFGPRTLRLVTHRDVSDEDVDFVVAAFHDIGAFAWTASGGRVRAEEAPLQSMLTIAAPFSDVGASQVSNNEAPQIPDPSIGLLESPLGPLLNEVFTEGMVMEAPSVLAPVATTAADSNMEVFFEEVFIYGMSVSEEGFVVLLQGTVCDRLLKIVVTPADPMADGLDTEQVETSEAVTLLQLLQGIDVESYLAKDALSVKLGKPTEMKGDGGVDGSNEWPSAEAEQLFMEQQHGGEASRGIGGVGSGSGASNGKTKHKKYSLKRVMIDKVDANDPKKFSARLVAVSKKQCNTTTTANTAADSSQATTAGEVSLSFNGLAVIPGNEVPIVSDGSAPSASASSGGSSSSSSSVVREVHVREAFEAVALALRHKAAIEVRSDLLLEDKLTYTVEELSEYFPQLLEAPPGQGESPVLGDQEKAKPPLAETEDHIERLQRQLSEAKRQKNEAKIESLQMQLSISTKLVENGSDGLVSIVLPPVLNGDRDDLVLADDM